SGRCAHDAAHGVIGVVGRRVRLRQGGRGKGAQGGEENKALDQHCADVGRIAPAGNAAQWLCEGPYLPLKGGGHPDYSTPIPSRPPTKLRASPSSSPQRQAGGKSCEVARIGCLRSRPQAVFISVRGPPAWLFHEMSSFSRLELAAGGPWGQDV